MRCLLGLDCHGKSLPNFLLEGARELVSRARHLQYHLMLQYLHEPQILWGRTEHLEPGHNLTWREAHFLRVDSMSFSTTCTLRGADCLTSGAAGSSREVHLKVA